MHLASGEAEKPTLDEAAQCLDALLTEGEPAASDIIRLPQGEAMVIAHLLAELDLRLPEVPSSRREHGLNVMCQWLASRIWERLGI